MSGRLSQWAMELGEFVITYKIRTAIKSQALVDFIVEMAPEEQIELHDGALQAFGEWTLRVDGSSNIRGYGIGICLESPTKEVIKQSFRLGFRASNNEAEYEAAIAG